MSNHNIHFVFLVIESYGFYCVYLYEVAPNKCVSWATFCKLQFTLPFKCQVKKLCSLYYFLSFMKWKKQKQRGMIHYFSFQGYRSNEPGNYQYVSYCLNPLGVQTFLCKYANMAKKWQQYRFNGSSCKKSPQPSYIALFLSLYCLFEQRWNFPIFKGQLILFAQKLRYESSTLILYKYWVALSFKCEWVSQSVRHR